MKSYAAHAAEFHRHPPTAPPAVIPTIVFPPTSPCLLPSDIPCAAQDLDGLATSPPRLLRSEDIAAFISEARLRFSPERSLSAPSSSLVVLHGEPDPTNTHSFLSENNSVVHHPPGLLVNFGSRHTSPGAISSARTASPASSPFSGFPPTRWRHLMDLEGYNKRALRRASSNSVKWMLGTRRGWPLSTNSFQRYGAH